MNYMKLALFGLLLILFACQNAVTDNTVKFQSHQLYLKFDVPNHSAHISDNGLVQIPPDGKAEFRINKTAKIEKFMIDSKEIPFKDTIPYEDSSYAVVSFEYKTDKIVPFTFVYTATFDDPVEGVKFSNENVGREVSGTILDKGAYLSGSAYFYPQGNEEMESFVVQVDIPATWESVADGNKKEQRVEGDRKVQTWDNPYKSDGLTFMAAPYVTKDTIVKDVDIACYFFAEDTSLFDGYLDATVDYINMYDTMIGTYPYNSFIVAENFFPTGYGMPGWTLLGQQVLRLPFIKFTSLGHEVLHNWWGNSVYVDYKRGNWCEAATVYGADYHYKLMQSADAAKSYRKDILKQYVSYVNEGNDFPIREFTSRTSPGTRTIGYNKAMMVYHMIEQEIGSDAFWQTWKNVYKDYINTEISWEEWIKEFEKASGKDLSHVIPQWIDQAGAPEIGLSDVSTSDENGEKKVTFKLSENSGQHYDLLIPVRFAGKDTSFDTTVALSTKEQTYQMNIPATATKIEIDPDYHLFRKLYPEEVEPIVAAVLGFDKHVYADDDNESMEADYLAKFASAVGDENSEIQNTASVQTDSTSSVILLNPKTIPDYLNERVTVADGKVTIKGQTYDLSDHTAVLTGDKLGQSKKYMVLLSGNLESLERIGQLVPHYGKYSYLVFEGSHNIAKGQWDITNSPLKVILPYPASPNLPKLEKTKLKKAS